MTSGPEDETTPARAHLNPLLKIAIEVGPLVLFFIANTRWGIFAATGVFMAAAVGSLALSYGLTRKIAMMPLVTCVFVIVFGGATLWFNDETFIKIKPTVIYGLFAVILLGGLAAGKALLEPVFSETIKMTAAGWRKLTLRWGLFFVAIAILNEAVWRTFSTDAWVNFKVFGVLPLTLIFALAQTRLMLRHGTEDETD